jgi:hypothetical protein
MRIGVSNNIGPMNAAVDLPPAVASYLRAFALNGRRLALLRAIGIALATFLIWAGFCCGADRLLQLSQGVRLTLLGCGAGLAGAIVTRAIWRASGRVDWVDIAAQIERIDPRFSQSLLTVVSQLTGDRSNRGSEEMLSHVLRDVENHVAAGHPRSFASITSIALPWILCAVMAGSALILNRHAQLGIGQLALRFVTPVSDIPPVTTTEIFAFPGDRDIVQSQPLIIEVRVTRLNGGTVFLFLNTQGDWYRVALTSTDGTTFNYRLASVDRDVRYYVAAGDAVTPNYTVRVLRRPTISRFQIQYVFPPYVRKAPITVTNTDGLIEAPVNSKAVLTIFCSDPLQSALLTIGPDKILMSRTDDNAARRAAFNVTQDTAYTIDLISNREVAGSAPPGTRIHPLMDQPPVARLFEAGDELRLTPRDIVTVNYEAADDYALTRLWLRLQTNGGRPVDRPIPLHGSRLRQIGDAQVDLAAFPLKLGDTARVSVVAEDTAGQNAISAPLRIVVSPRSIDLDTGTRITELDGACEFARKLTLDLESSRDAIGLAAGIGNKRSSAFAAASARANLSLANASESATLTRQCLCRAILHCGDAQLAVAMADWSDSAESLSAAVDDLFRQRGASDASAESADPALQRAIDASHRLADDISSGWQAELAAALEIERGDVRVMKQPVSALRSDSRLRELNINPNGDIDQQLQAKIGAGRGVISRAAPIDFAAAARAWAEDAARGQIQANGLDRRLGAAAEAEAVSPDSNLQRARDLQLASRAAVAIGNALLEKHPEASTAAAQVGAFASAMTALQREWNQTATPAEPRSPADAKSIATQAIAARQQLLNWAPDMALTPTTAAAVNRSSAEITSASQKKDAEDLALQASAAAAEKDYARAARLDDVLDHRLDQVAPIPGSSVARAPSLEVELGQERVAAAMDAARTIDGIGQSQDAVVEGTRGAHQASADDLAGKQRHVADAIAAFVTQRSDTTELNSREQAVTAFLGVQEQLAALPQKLADALEAQTAQRAAATAASRAQAAELRLGKSVSSDDRGMAHRAAVEAANELGEASDRTESALAQIDPAQAAAWTDELGPYAPESATASDMIQTQLVPALAGLRQVMRVGDESAISRVASEVRSSIASVQRSLAAAQDALTARDPMVAAKSFAGAAADALAQSPPDVNGALEKQVRATGALARAWDQSIHDAAAHRLAIVPSMEPVYGLAAPGEASRWNGGPAGGSTAWVHISPGETDSLNFPTHDTDPAGYEEPLRIYFEALGKAQAARGK